LLVLCLRVPCANTVMPLREEPLVNPEEECGD